tara:strand:+ start:273 stop:581 length:309 start_codon:yes stop_codon:yes gene_type:complete
MAVTAFYSIRIVFFKQSFRQELPEQDVVGYQKLLRFYMRDVEIGANLGTSVIARGTPGFFGADLTNLMNEVDLMAACGRRKFVGMAEFEAAKDKMLMGTERQ